MQHSSPPAPWYFYTTEISNFMVKYIKIAFFFFFFYKLGLLIISVSNPLCWKKSMTGKKKYSNRKENMCKLYHFGSAFNEISDCVFRWIILPGHWYLWKVFMKISSRKTWECKITLTIRSHQNCYYLLKTPDGNLRKVERGPMKRAQD